LLDLLRENEVFKEYIAYSFLEKKLVRIKILNERLKENKKFVSDLKRILQVSHLFSSERFMKIINFFEEEDFFWIVEEYTEGEYLEKIIKSGKLQISDSLKYVFQICEGIKYLEEKNLIHGGISPSSIWITKDVDVKITNFGIIPLLYQTEEKIFSLSNLNYITPEQIISKKVEKTTDIFAVGTLFLEMLNSSTKTPPSEFLNIINKARHKNPNLRYKSIQEFSQDLREVSQITPPETEEKIEKKDLEVVRDIKIKPKRVIKKNEIYSCFLVIFIFLLLVFLSIWGIYKIFLPSGKEVIVPDVIGKNFFEAEKILKENYLRVNVMSKEYSDKYPENTVISQAPLPGSKRLEGKIVNLILSLGPEKVNVPDLRNKKLREAKIELQRINLKIGREEYISNDEIPEGVIIEQSPSPNTLVPKNTKVDLTISSGPEKTKVEVPELKGMTVEEVEQMLSLIKLKIGLKREVFKRDIPKGIIISQSPSAGTLVEQNTPINIIVSAGPKEEEIDEEIKEAELFINIPPGPSKVEVKVIVIDKEGARTVYQKFHLPKEELKIPVKGRGNTTVKVFIGGELVKEEEL
jgi:serine/threonine-protein kinase